MERKLHLRWHRPLHSVLQKLGIPAEISTTYQGYYANAIEDLAKNDSLDIIPGVQKLDYGYGAACAHRMPTAPGWRHLDGSACVQPSRGRSGSTTSRKSNLQASGWIRRPVPAPTANTRAPPLSCAALRRESVRFAPASFACLPSIVMAGSLAAPSRTGFYVQQSVVDRLYALPPGKPSAASEIFGPGPWHALAWHNAAASCSPALASHRGMRHHEAAEAVGFTVHAGDHSCMRGDSCPQQRDAISNLTRAMSDGLFRVEFHSATAKAKAYRDFINEVRLQALAVEACPDRKWCRRNRRA